ncbi:MAG: HEAT repeat domain-containing protein [Chitinophagaceae bacterium]|nr:HEAT repeat domain-containing protein [Oligoflexus sp.]
MFGSVKEYFDGRKSKRVERAGRLVTNAKAIKDDRWAALEFLALGLDNADEAIPALLPRFEYSLEHGINDTREKELAMKGIVRYGEKAIPFIKDWLQKTTRIAWPIKILYELGQDQVVVDCLKAALNYGEVAFSQNDVDKNYDILCYLRDYQIHDLIPQIAHFLVDQDERVRYAAAEVLIAQKTDDVKDQLAPFLLDDTSENRRLRGAVAQLFIERQWKVTNPAQFQGGQVTEQISVGADGRLVHN